MIMLTLILQSASLGADVPYKCIQMAYYIRLRQLM